MCEVAHKRSFCSLINQPDSIKINLQCKDRINVEHKEITFILCKEKDISLFNNHGLKQYKVLFWGLNLLSKIFHPIYLI